MKQLITPNLTVQGKAGWCLSVQQDVWGVPHIYPKAIDAWNASGLSNHPNEQPPNDVCVPVYWTYTEGGIQYGHIAAWVPGRGVFSSPFNVAYGNQWFPSIQSVTDRINKIAGANSQYLGWSETLSNVQLVAQGEDMITQATLTFIFQQLLGRSPDQGAITHYVGVYTPDFVREDVLKSTEYKTHTANVAAAQTAANAEVQSQIAVLSVQIKDLTAKLASTQAAVDIKQKEIDKLSANPGTPDSTAIQQTNTNVNWLVAAFKKLFNIGG